MTIAGEGEGLMDTRHNRQPCEYAAEKREPRREECVCMLFGIMPVLCLAGLALVVSGACSENACFGVHYPWLKLCCAGQLVNFAIVTFYPWKQLTGSGVRMCGILGILNSVAVIPAFIWMLYPRC